MTKKVKFRSRQLRQLISLALALLLIGSVSFLGVRYYNSSKAATPGTMYISPASANWTAGSNVSVTIREESGSTPVNSAQVGLTYNPSQLQFVSMTEGDFNTAFNTDTDQAGVIRAVRGMDPGTLTGDRAIITVTFKVLATSGTANVNIDREYSFVANANGDILQSVAGGSYTVVQPVFKDAVLSFGTTSGNLTTGQTLSVPVRVKSPTQKVFSVNPIIVYPANQLQYISTNDSATFPSASRTNNTSGNLDIIRGVKAGTSGFSGEDVVVTVNFKVIGTSGTVPLSFRDTSKVLDGNANNLLGGRGDANFAIGTTTPAPGPTNPDPTPPTNPTIPNTPNQPVTSTNPATNTPLYRGSVTYRAPAGSNKVSVSNSGTQVQGSLELAPIADPEILAKNPGDSIIKVEYYLGRQLVTTKTEAPFSYTIDTKQLRNGRYDMIIRTYYESGTVDSSTDKLIVKNPVTVPYIMVHYGSGILASIFGLAIVAFVAWKYLLPKFPGRAVATAGAGYGGYMTYDDPGAMGTTPSFQAPGPAIIAPSNSAPGSDVIAPEQSQAAQSTPPLPVDPTQPAVMTPQAPTPTPQPGQVYGQQPPAQPPQNPSGQGPTQQPPAAPQG